MTHYFETFGGGAGFFVHSTRFSLTTSNQLLNGVMTELVQHSIIGSVTENILTENLSDCAAG